MGVTFQVAIDGPSAAGKSTIAKRVAEELGAEYIDTGAMYRAFAYKVLMLGVASDDSAAVYEVLQKTTIDQINGRTLLDGEDVSEQIRKAEVTRQASVVSVFPRVREWLVRLQREMADAKNVVMDGRDIGTNVFPDAQFKFFLTASVEERARRRWEEMKEQGSTKDLLSIQREIAKRDQKDASRTLNPLVKARDAIEIDTTEKTADEVTNQILGIIRG